MIVIIIIILVGVAIGFIGRAKANYELNKEWQNRTDFYNERKTKGPYSVGDFFCGGDKYEEGMIVSLNPDRTHGRYVVLTSGEDDSSDVVTYNRFLPTIEELETISHLVPRFLELRKTYGFSQTHSITTDKANKPKLYISSSYDRYESRRYFYDMKNHKKLLMIAKDDYYYPEKNGFMHINYYSMVMKSF